MIRILDITLKDLRQLTRERETFLFLLIMPVVFTFLFGFAFGGFSSGESDPRLPVGFLDEDGTSISRELHELLLASEVLRLEEEESGQTRQELERLVAEGELAAAVILPAGYGQAALDGEPIAMALVTDPAASAGAAIESEVLRVAQRLMNALRAAQVVAHVSGTEAALEPAFDRALSAWDTPPVTVRETTSAAIERQDNRILSLAHTAPAMMVQFAMAAPMTAGQIMVNERKSRAFQRLLTTATPRSFVLLGHFLAMLALILAQFTLLISFAQFVLGVDYLRAPLAILVVALATALCVASMGLLIGTLAKNEDQAVIYSLVPMFVLSGLGGAWVPLEVTGPAFQAIGHVSPLAWAMDGLKNIVSRGLGFESVLLPSAALLGYAVAFFALAVWRFHSIQER